MFENVDKALNGTSKETKSDDIKETVNNVVTIKENIEKLKPACRARYVEKLKPICKKLNRVLTWGAIVGGLAGLGVFCYEFTIWNAGNN
jgi:hypothetical protein